MGLTEAGYRHADEWLRGINRGSCAVGNDEVMGRLVADEIDHLRTRLESARRLLRNVTFCPPTFDDDRIKIIDIQLDRCDYNDITAWLAEDGEE